MGKTLGLLIALCCVLSNHLTLSEQSKKKKESRIVIIGAGASGIATASKLFQEGFENVKILEATDRIGGRIFTTEFGGYEVDLGAQWVGGEEGNVIYELAEPLGLLEKNDGPYGGFELTFQDSEGNSFNDSMSALLKDFFVTYFYLGEVVDEPLTSWSSLGAFFDERFGMKFNNTPLLAKKKPLMHMFEMIQMCEIAADSWWDVPLDDADYEEYPGNQVINWKEFGFSKILEILIKKYPDPKKELPIINNTIFNSEVSKIDWSGDSVNVALPNGTNITADHVIVTVPLGVLKENYTSMFHPPLPSSKVNVIKNLEFGVVDKIVMQFEKPFWNVQDKRILLMTFVWDEEITKTLEEDPEKMWTLGAFGVTSVEHKPNLLMLWISGKYARAMESLPDETVSSHTIELLHKFLDKIYNVTDPLKIIRTRWFNDPHFRGTWSFKSVKNFEDKISNSELEEPIDAKNLKILFAGEATSLHHEATVHGAIESGYAAAHRLIERYRSEEI